VERLDRIEMGDKGRGELLGKQGHAILPALAVPHEKLPPGEVEILDSEGRTLQEPQAGSVQQTRHESRGTAGLCENGLSFLPGEDEG
jgi:hypothetical protein